MEVTLVLIKEPTICPVCRESGRSGFLFVQSEQEQVFGSNGTKSSLICKTCGALFTVEDGKAI